MTLEEFLKYEVVPPFNNFSDNLLVLEIENFHGATRRLNIKSIKNDKNTLVIVAAEPVAFTPEDKD